jgi:hypothetical protein
MPAHARRPYGRGQGRGGNARWAPGRVALPFQTRGTIIAGDASGRVHFLELVEADPIKPSIGETKIQLLRCNEPGTDS